MERPAAVAIMEFIRILGDALRSHSSPVMRTPPFVLSALFTCVYVKFCILFIDDSPWHDTLLILQGSTASFAMTDQGLRERKYLYLFGNKYT